jgi:hypothetical protein
VAAIYDIGIFRKCKSRIGSASARRESLFCDWPVDDAVAVIAAMHSGPTVVSHEEICAAAGVSLDQVNLVIIELVRLELGEKD